MLINTPIADILGDEYTQLDPEVYRTFNNAAEEALAIFTRMEWTWAGREVTEFTIMAMLWQLTFSCLRTLHNDPDKPWTQASSGRLQVTVSRYGELPYVRFNVTTQLSGKNRVLFSH